MSSASTLLTPTDLSPARPLDSKLHSLYDPHTSPFSSSVYNSIPNVHHHNSLLFEHSSPARPFEHRLLSSPQSPPYRTLLQPQPSYLLSPHSFPLFEPFSEQPTPAPTQSHSHMQMWHSSPSQAPQQQQQQQQQSYYTAVPQETRRSELRRVPSVSWRQPQLPTPSEWLRPEDKLVAIDYNMGSGGNGMFNGEQQHLTTPPRFSFSHQSPPGNAFPSAPAHLPTPPLAVPAHAHEVCRGLIDKLFD